VNDETAARVSEQVCGAGEVAGPARCDLPANHDSEIHRQTLPDGTVLRWYRGWGGTERCPAEYPRSPNPLPNTRIVRCHLEAGHPGEHEEADTDVTWTDDADETSAQPEQVRREIANAHRDEVIEGSGEAIEPREVPPFPPAFDDWNSPEDAVYGQPDVAPSPDVDAAGPRDEVYLTAARAYCDPRFDTLRTVRVVAADRAFRAAVDATWDAGRVPLIAELAACERNIEDLNAKVVRCVQADRRRA
jgi:hypothetical protein